MLVPQQTKNLTLNLQPITFINLNNYYECDNYFK